MYVGIFSDILKVSQQVSLKCKTYMSTLDAVFDKYQNDRRK